MTRKLTETCFSMRPQLKDIREVHLWADHWGARLAGSGDAMVALLEKVAGEPDLPDDLLVLMTCVLDSLRMNRENGETGADATFELVLDWLKHSAPDLAPPEKMALCQVYLRAGLEPPDAIRLSEEDMPEMAQSGAEMPDIDALLRDLIPDDVTGYPAYMILREGLGAMPNEAAALFISQMMVQTMPDAVSLGRYFLIDPQASLRAAAAAAFAELAERGQIDAAILSELIGLRKWLPREDARTVLDSAIHTALRREASGGSVPSPWRVHRLLASLPDGTGSQSIVATVSKGRDKQVVNLLWKAGHGIKDAYAIPCESATAQRQMLAQIEDNVPLHEVTPEFVASAMACALGEHLPPAPGFIDAAQMLGVRDITPVHASPEQIADPDGEVASLSPQKRGRLIGRSLHWPAWFEMSSSWFVTNTSLSSALEDARTERAAERAVWAELDTQRRVWAMIFARAAAVLRCSDDVEWRSFAAVVQGLETGRALNKIPIFEMIVALTLDVAEQEGHAALTSELEDEDFGDAPEFDIAPEGKGELARLLKGTGWSPDHLDGYLTGVIVAPEFATPDVWVQPLLTEIATMNPDSLQRMLDIVMLRYGRIRDAVLQDSFGADLRGLPSKRLAGWLSGFSHAGALKAAWPTRRLSKQDRKILALIAEGAKDMGAQQTVAPLLADWLQNKIVLAFA